MREDEIGEVVRLAHALGTSDTAQLKAALANRQQRRTGRVPRHHELDAMIDRAIESGRLVRDRDMNLRAAD